MSFAVLDDSWLESYFQQMIRLVAGRVGIADLEWKSSIELFDELDRTRPATAAQLRVFFTAYKQWFDDAKEFNQKVLDGNLSEQDRKKALSHIFARDDARQELLKTL